MALSSRADPHLLPCGRDVEHLWQRIDDPPDGHERSCPHCRTARSSLQALAEAADALRLDDPVTPPPSLRSRIMSAVRADLRRGSPLALAAGDWGPIEVSRPAIAAVLRFAADGVDGVRARRCRIRPVPAAGSPGSLPTVRVEMSLSVSTRAGSILVLVEEVRNRVRAAAVTRIGLEVTAVDIEVEDVHVPPDRTAADR